MRNLMMAVLVVGLLAASSYGVINISVTADKTTLNPGDTTTVRIWGQGNAAGLFSLGGAVSGTSGVISANAGTGAWLSTFFPTFGLSPKVGLAGSNGGWTGLGSDQTNYLAPDANFAKAALVDLFDYTVTAGAVQGNSVLTFVPGTVSGFKAAETNSSIAMGTVLPVTITVTPEPVTLALLALGGLFVARRRHA